MGKNFKKDESGDKVVWNRICSSKVDKFRPFTIMYKTNYENEEFKVNQ